MADDITLIANNKTSLQNMINTVTSYANSLGYHLNESKCKCLVFNGNRKTAKININGTILTSCNAATHVGIELNTTVKSAAAIDARVRKGRSSLFSLLTIRDSQYDVNPLVLADLVQKITLPVVLYGSELWSSMTHSDTMKLEVCFANCRKALS